MPVPVGKRASSSSMFSTIEVQRFWNFDPLIFDLASLTLTLTLTTEH